MQHLPAHKPRYLMLCILSALPMLAHAQQAEDEGKKESTMAEVEVSAPVEQTINQQTVGRDTLDRAGAANLDSAMRYTPGVLVGGKAKKSGNGSINIRGMTKNRVGMKVDGIDLPDGFFNWGHGQAIAVGRDSIETDTLRQIDVAKGAGAMSEDASSFGGSINMRTFRPDDFVSAQKPWYVGIKPSWHSVNSGKAVTLTGAAQMNNISGLLMITRREEKEEKNMGKLNIPGPNRTKPNPQDIKGTNILAKAAIKWDNYQRLDLTAERFERESWTNLLSNLGKSRRGIITNLYHNADEYTRNRLSAQYTWHRMPGWLDTFSARVYHQKGEHSSVSNVLLKQRGQNIKQVSTALFEQKISGVKFLLTGTIEAGDAMEHKLRTELEYQKKDSSRPEHRLQTRRGKTAVPKGYPKKNMPDTDSTKLTFSLADRMVFKNYGLSITPKLNYMRHNIKPTIDQAYLNSGFKAAPEYDNNTLNPSLAIDWQLNDALSLHAVYAHGTQNPPYDSLIGLFHPVRPPWTLMQFMPNPNLKTEKSDSLDLGLQYNTNNLDLQFNVFHNRYKDFIKRFGTVITRKPPTMILMTDNVDSVKTWGAELAGSWRFTPGWRLNGALSWMRGDQTNKGKKSPFNSVQPARMVLGLAYDQKTWGANVDWTLSAKQKRLSSARMWRSPGYGVVDLSAWWKAGKHVEIQAGIYNVGDKKYYNPGDVELLNESGTRQSDLYSQPGRNASVTMTIRF